ncbi:MAG TPA: RluA family pseudouridine synthase [Candidatus Bathyarchaeia archaeon]|nr:RluA family pseudouridine synthase [Candidatus Bathyarchaeia archaeon]
MNKKRHPNRKIQATSRTYTVKEPMELLPFLLKNITNRSRNSVKSLLTRGQVSVNERVVNAHNFALQTGQIVTIQDKAAEDSKMVGLTILYEDEDIIVIEKDAGLLSVAAPQQNELTAYRQLMAHVRKENPQNRIFVVHRLDRDTSGVMMFSKSKNVQQILQNSWKDIVRERTYIALVEGEVKKRESTISSWLKESKTLKMYSSPRPNDGQHAVTHYKVIQANRNYSLLEVNLETGRKNQIRVHMEDIGHPIVGDKKYGAKTRSIGRLGLHARILSFEHPTTGELMRFESDIPKAFLSPFSRGSVPYS